jgi:hypothetical protein
MRSSCGGAGSPRATARAGGIEGGMSTGQPIRMRAAMKPFSTVPRPLRTVDLATGEPAVAIKQRTDVCAVPAGGVVGEAVVAFVLRRDAREVRGDSLRRRGGTSTGTGGPPVIVYRSGCPVRASHRRTRGRGSSGCSIRRPRWRDRATHGSTVAEIFSTEGEAAFRASGGERSSSRCRAMTPR